MKRAFVSIVFAVGMLLIGAGLTAAQTSVAGEWDGAFETPGGARPFKLVLKAEGEKLTGTAKRSSGDVPITGTIKGSDIAFSYIISYNGNDLTMSFSGKVTGDSMSGSVSFGGQASETFTAKKAAPAKPKSDK